jgi:hypothetical protein
LQDFRAAVLMDLDGFQGGDLCLAVRESGIIPHPGRVF